MFGTTLAGAREAHDALGAVAREGERGRQEAFDVEQLLERRPRAQILRADSISPGGPQT